MVCCKTGVILWIFLTIFISNFKETHSDVLAKSSLQICENTGDSEDPFNVVEQKACEKKLIVTLSVRSGQNGTEFLKTVTNVSKVYDQTEKEMARLYNPFVITLAKTPVTLTYPFYYLGTVNNKPSEVVVIREGGDWLVSGSFDACSDAWGDENALCGFAKDQKGKPIWDSQGFCCRCTEQEKWRGSFNDKNPYSRAGIDCKIFGKQASAHCMKMDELWYTVNEIGLWQMDFSIHVKAYDQVIKKEGNKTTTKWVDGGEIIIGPTIRSGRGKYDRIFATFIGEFQSHKQFPVLTTKYILIPYASAKIDPKTHPQFRNGPRDFLMVDKHEVNYKSTGPHECDKIGVTFTAFRAQAPMGCSQKQQACLNNQPKDYFTEDKKRRENGETPHYFPEKYGKLLGVKKNMDTSNYVLTYEVDEVMTSMVTLQISADDIILIYNRATGKILRAYAQDFEALSRDGNLYVVIQNTGLVTADFYVVVRDCSVGIVKLLEKSASVNPQQTHTFTFNVKAQQWKGGNNYCITQLYDARRKLIDTSNVTFKTTAPCVCATSCGCSCFKEGFKCVEREIEGGTKFKPKDDGVDLGFFPKLWNGIKNIFNKFASLWDLLGEFKSLIFLVLSLLSLGGVKAVLGMRKAAIARFGMGMGGGTRGRNAAGQVVIMEYNEQGDGIDPHTNEVIEPRNKKLEILFNVFFFFILPFLLIHVLVIHIRKRRHLHTNQYEEVYQEEGLDKLEEGDIEGSESTIYPSDEDKQEDPLEKFTALNTIVYHKYHQDDSIAQLLINTGEEFCLAGEVTLIPGTQDYRFELYQPTQVFEVENGERKSLPESHSLNPEDFSRILYSATLQQYLTLEPPSPCLNLE